jgi:hypothetical protein
MSYERGLVSIDYFTASREVRMVYEPDTEYDIKDILAYVHDMSAGRSTHVTVYEGDRLMHDMRQMGNAGWVNIAKQASNGL